MTLCVTRRVKSLQISACCNKVAEEWRIVDIVSSAVVEPASSADTTAPTTPVNAQLGGMEPRWTILDIVGL